MTVSSMTGFARTEGEDDLIRWVWEARSVNGKSLDARIRVPSGWERFDPVIRKAVQERFKRGNLTINLEVKPILGKSTVRINDALLDDLIQRCEAFGERPRLDLLFTVRGVVEASEQDPGDLASDPEWFVQKAIAWWLRDLSRHAPEQVHDWLTEHGDALKPFARKEAARHLP